jgi:leucyl-tRNA synthetase
MSKSKGNVVDPNTMIERFGADTVRLFMLFAAPPERDLEWSDRGVEGAHRFLHRVWRLVAENIDGLKGADLKDADLREASSKSPVLKALRHKTHLTIRKATDDIEARYHFNTAISAVMELVNQTTSVLQQGSGKTYLQDFWLVVREAAETVLLLLSPIAPHMTAELWSMLGHTRIISEEPWPQVDEDAVKVESVAVVIQVNGKVRARIQAPAGSSQDDVHALALQEANIRRYVEGKQIRKLVYIPDRLLNMVV